MTKAELAERVADRVHLTKRQTEAIVGILLACITEALREGDKVELRGFGSFRTRSRNARQGRNPKTGDAIQRREGASGEERCPKGEGSREWLCLLPRKKTGKPGSITCPSEGTALEGAGLSRRQQARRPTGRAARRRAEAVPLPHINCCSRSSRCSVCETHDPTGELSAGNPPAQFGER